MLQVQSLTTTYLAVVSPRIAFSCLPLSDLISFQLPSETLWTVLTDYGFPPTKRPSECYQMASEA